MDRVLIAVAVVALAGVLAALWRARRERAILRVDPADFGLDGSGHAVAGFTSPMCHSCGLWMTELETNGIAPAFVDVKERPDLAERYGVRSTPAVLLVDLDDGTVVRHFHGDPHAADVNEIRDAVLAGV
jgi:hypothetical protein